MNQAASIVLAAMILVSSRVLEKDANALQKEINMTNEMLFIPRGEFVMGLSKEQSENLVMEFTPESSTISPYIFYPEVPEHTLKINDFSISKFEVMNSEYKQFVDEGGYDRKEFWRELVEIRELNTDQVGWDRITLFKDRTGKPGPSSWSNGTYSEGKADHPVDGVSWFEAVAFCRWKRMRLPSEIEWEYVARGSDKRIFPWGNDPNVFQKWEGRQSGESTVAGSIPFDKSPFGVMDLARNVAEWVMDSWYLYPGAPVDPQRADEGFGILRGGDYSSPVLYMRTTCRIKTERLERRPGIGFRYAK